MMSYQLVPYSVNKTPIFIPAYPSAKPKPPVSKTKTLKQNKNNRPEKQITHNNKPKISTTKHRKPATPKPKSEPTLWKRFSDRVNKFKYSYFVVVFLIQIACANAAVVKLPNIKNGCLLNITVDAPLYVNGILFAEPFIIFSKDNQTRKLETSAEKHVFPHSVICDKPTSTPAPVTSSVLTTTKPATAATPTTTKTITTATTALPVTTTTVPISSTDQFNKLVTGFSQEPTAIKIGTTNHLPTTDFVATTFHPIDLKLSNTIDSNFQKLMNNDDPRSVFAQFQNCSISCVADNCLEFVDHVLTPMTRKKFRGGYYFVGTHYYALASLVKRSFGHLSLPCLTETGTFCGFLQPSHSFIHACFEYSADKHVARKQSRAPTSDTSDATDTYYSEQRVSQNFWQSVYDKTIQSADFILEFTFWSVAGFIAFSLFGWRGAILVLVIRYLTFVSSQTCTDIPNYGVIATTTDSHASFMLSGGMCASATAGTKRIVFKNLGAIVVSNPVLEQVIPLRANVDVINKFYCAGLFTSNDTNACPCYDAPLGYFDGYCSNRHTAYPLKKFFECTVNGGYICTTTQVFVDPDFQLHVYRLPVWNTMTRLSITANSQSTEFVISSDHTTYKHTTLGNLRLSSRLTQNFGTRYVWLLVDHSVQPARSSACVVGVPFTKYRNSWFKTSATAPLENQLANIKIDSCPEDNCVVIADSDMVSFYNDLIKRNEFDCVNAQVNVAQDGTLTYSNLSMNLPTEITIDFDSHIDGFEPTNVCTNDVFKVEKLTTVTLEHVEYMQVDYKLLDVVSFACVVLLPNPPPVCSFSDHHFSILPENIPGENYVTNVVYTCYVDSDYSAFAYSVHLRGGGFIGSIVKRSNDLWSKYVGQAIDMNTFNPFTAGYGIWAGILETVWDFSLGNFINIPFQKIEKFLVSVLVAFIVGYFFGIKWGLISGLTVYFAISIGVVNGLVSFECQPGFFCGFGHCQDGMIAKCVCDKPGLDSHCAFYEVSECKNGGSAYAKETGFGCLCTPDWEGELCEFPINSCQNLATNSIVSTEGCFYAADSCDQRADSGPAIVNAFEILDVLRSEYYKLGNNSLRIGLYQTSCANEPDCGWVWSSFEPATFIPWAVQSTNRRVTYPARSTVADMSPASVGIFDLAALGLYDRQHTNEKLLCSAGTNRCQMSCLYGRCVGTRCLCAEGHTGLDCSATIPCVYGYRAGNTCQCSGLYTGSDCSIPACECDVGVPFQGQCWDYSTTTCAGPMALSRTEFLRIPENVKLDYGLIGNGQTAKVDIYSLDGLARLYSPPMVDLGNFAYPLTRNGDYITDVKKIKNWCAVGTPTGYCPPKMCQYLGVDQYCKNYNCLDCVLVACGREIDLLSFNATEKLTIAGQPVVGPYVSGLFDLNCTDFTYLPPRPVCNFVGLDATCSNYACTDCILVACGYEIDLTNVTGGQTIGGKPFSGQYVSGLFDLSCATFTYRIKPVCPNCNGDCLLVNNVSTCVCPYYGIDAACLNYNCIDCVLVACGQEIDLQNIAGQTINHQPVSGQYVGGLFDLDCKNFTYLPKRPHCVNCHGNCILVDDKSKCVCPAGTEGPLCTPICQYTGVDSTCHNYRCNDCLLSACGTVIDLKNFTGLTIGGVPASSPYTGGFFDIDCKNFSYLARPVVEIIEPSCHDCYGKCILVGRISKCVCPENTSGVRCLPNLPVQCLHGKLVDGFCLCSTGWTGVSCADKLTTNCDPRAQDCPHTHHCPYFWPLCLIYCDQCPGGYNTQTDRLGYYQCPWPTPLSFLCPYEGSTDERCVHFPFCHKTDNAVYKKTNYMEYFQNFTRRSTLPVTTPTTVSSTTTVLSTTTTKYVPYCFTCGQCTVEYCYTDATNTSFTVGAIAQSVNLACKPPIPKPCCPGYSKALIGGIEVCF